MTREACARHPIGMTQRDGAAIDVEPFGIDPQRIAA